MSCILPVSIGEAFDKLSILDIKKEKITTVEKREYVLNEYNNVRTTISDTITSYEHLYIFLKKVNLHIWGQMDELRDGSLTDEEYTKLCKECIICNDVRFRIKNKINIICNSTLKEQKSYTIKYIRINVNDSFNFKDIYNIIFIMSCIYDAVYIHGGYAESLPKYIVEDPAIITDLTLIPEKSICVHSITLQSDISYTDEKILELCKVGHEYAYLLH